ncbi:MAG: YbhB/YbcL family Raf kinase inhibitor-like protein [Mycoplasmatales bacterium]
MKIIVEKATTNNVLFDKYTKHCSIPEQIEGVPFISFPFEVQDCTTKYISWVLIDHDSYPVVHFSWIHWLVANVTERNIPENFSQLDDLHDRGFNSFASPLMEVAAHDLISGYGGPMPPDKDHNYSLIVYGHDQKLELESPFHFNQFLKQLETKSIEKHEIQVIGRV